MKKNAFELLEVREVEEPPIDFDSFEKEVRTKIPPIYRLFLETFSCRWSSNLRNEFLNPSNDRIQNFIEIFYRPNPSLIGVYDFLNIEQARLIYSNINQDENFRNFGIFPVAQSPGEAYIMVGVSLENFDQIFFFRFFSEPPALKIANNIFEFIKCLEMKPFDELLLGGISYSQFYQNWDETFWRVRTAT